MGFLVTAIVLAIATFVALGALNVWLVTRKNEEIKLRNMNRGYGTIDKVEEIKLLKVKFVSKLSLLALIPLLIAIPAFMAVVPANSVGIVYSAISGTSNQTLSEGYHFKSPIDKVYNIDTQVKTVSVEGLTTQTKDSQFLVSKLDIKYSVNSSNAYIVFKQFKTLDNMQSQLIVSATQRVLEQITTAYNVMDILGSKRSEIYAELEKALKKEFKTSGVDFYSISITDMDAGDELEKAITAEAVAKKAVETAKQDLEKAKTEAQKQVVSAQAEQDAAKIIADTKVIQAKAEADSNKLLDASLTALIVQKMAVDKWNGVLPVVSGSSGSIMDISSLLGSVDKDTAK